LDKAADQRIYPQPLQLAENDSPLCRQCGHAQKLDKRAEFRFCGAAFVSTDLGLVYAKFSGKVGLSYSCAFPDGPDRLRKIGDLESAIANGRHHKHYAP